MDLFKIIERKQVRYDTFRSMTKRLKKSGDSSKRARRELKKQLEFEKFYEGFEEFIEQNRKSGK